MFRIFFSNLFASLLVLVAAGCGQFSNSQEAPAAKIDGKVTLKLTLPEHYDYKESDRFTTLTIEGKDFSETGKTERLIDIPLKEGQKNVKITFSFWPNNYTNIIRTKLVPVKKGETVKVDFTREDPKNPDKIKPIYFPTPYEVVDRMLRMGKVGKGDVVCDIGCGDGRLVIAAVKKFGAKRAFGYDINPDLIKTCRANAKKEGVADKVSFEVKDALTIKDLSEASVVTLYLGLDLNLKVKPVLQKTLKPGSRVVSHRFLMGDDWKPQKSQTITAKNNYDMDEEYELHLWTIGKKSPNDKK